ncbi:5'-nucleotidase [Arthrobacter crystallopoietes]|jgi:5'-nucleotidase|uniref:5'-nucleotidase n=1 Tax=Crystallibacter crystallopoietes TaxID=37928 RepID=UPI001FCA31E8|nr:5'-nucleotidase [Arthrobacter crystallopoietes]
MNALRVLKPHVFFDDQLGHLEGAADEIPSVHVPFGVVNEVKGTQRESLSE